MALQPFQREFIEFILDNDILLFGDFNLKSGRKSPYFFNLGLLYSGVHLTKLGYFYASAIKYFNFSFDVLFGPAYKGIPISVATAITLESVFHQDVPYCFNRKEVKSHGEKGQLIGSELKGDILLLDDVITAGTAIKESVTLFADYPAQLKYVLVALDRQERGLSELSAFQEIESLYGCNVFSIVQFDDILTYLEKMDKYEHVIGKMKTYRLEYGV